MTMNDEIYIYVYLNTNKRTRCDEYDDSGICPAVYGRRPYPVNFSLYILYFTDGIGKRNLFYISVCRPE